MTILPLDPILQSLVEDLDYHGVQIYRIEVRDGRMCIFTTGDLECVDPGFGGFIEDLRLPEVGG
jgi:hypothetical protein